MYMYACQNNMFVLAVLNITRDSDSREKWHTMQGCPMPMRFVSKVSDEQVSLKSKAQNSGSTWQMNCPKGIHHTTVTAITRSEPKQSVIQKQISPMCLCLTSVQLSCVQIPL